MKHLLVHPKTKHSLELAMDETLPLPDSAFSIWQAIRWNILQRSTK